MADNNTTRVALMSPVGVMAAAIGLLLLAYGITGLIFGGADLGTNPGGTVDGETWLGIEANGWTNIVFVGAGVLLMLGSPTRAGAIAALVLAGVGLGAAAIISLLDGEGVFGVLAANRWTMLSWGVTAIVLLAAAALPMIKSRRADRTASGPPADRERMERDEAFGRELFEPRGRMR